MLIPKRRYPKIAPSEITPEELYVNRRLFMKGSLSAAAALSTIQAQALVTPEGGSRLPEGPEWLQKAVVNAAETAFGAGEKTAPYSSATQYNNFYEFGSHKQISGAAQALRIRPWTVTIDGMVEKKLTLDIDTLLKKMRLEERLYRLRCVEAWSMAVPWSGFPLADLVKLARPLAGAKYLVMQTFKDAAMAPGQKQFWYPWPYTDGLTLAEATARYEQGMVLVRRGNQLLDQAELKITNLKDGYAQDPDGLLDGGPDEEEI